MGTQAALPISMDAPRGDISLALRSALAFWGETRDARTIARKVDDGRWELSVSVAGMPLVRAAGVTRDECLRAAYVEALRVLLRHEKELRRRAEVITDNANDIARFLATSTKGA